MYQLIYSLHNMSRPITPTDQYSNINTAKNQFHPDPASSQPTQMVGSTNLLYVGNLLQFLKYF
jgi:hypothetical protein